MAAMIGPIALKLAQADNEVSGAVGVGALGILGIAGQHPPIFVLPPGWP